MPELISLDDIHAAQHRIAPAAARTPLVRLDPVRLRDAGFAALADSLPSAIYLKDESAQPIGSFKLRGAYNKIAQLSPQELRQGVITYSSGNHAQGVAFSARSLGSKAVIVMPENAPAIKREATAALGAEIVTVGNASTERKQRAEELAAIYGYTIVPPYDDPAIIAGQATCGLEIVEQLADLEQLADIEQLGVLEQREARAIPAEIGDLILAPVSGGGLLSGVATGVALGSEAAGRTVPQVWGCEPDLAADAAESFRTRKLVEWPAAHTTRTLADGLRTQSLGELNFRHILQYVGGVQTVSEDELRSALRVFLRATDIVAEPSGAVTLAAALFHGNTLPPASRIVVVVSGGNLDPLLRAELEAEGAAIHV